MNVSEQFNVAGKFKFDIYTKTNELKYSSNFIDNFITNTGLEQIKTFAYADCFRYLSLGDGNNQNSIINPVIGSFRGTSGLHQPIPEFMFIGGNLSNSNCNGGIKDNDYVPKGCGYRIDQTGVTLNRSWRVPRVEYDINDNVVDTFFLTNHTFKEYMLTPGRTGVTGWSDLSKTTLTSICSCQEIVYNDNDEELYGRESPDFYGRYPNICSSTGAFTRILKDITVATNEYLVVTYALTIGLHNAKDGNRYFEIAVDHPPPPATSGPVYNWVRVSGYSSLIHPGLKLINNGDVTSVNYIVDQIPDYTYRLGESFIPPLGIAMEPSCPSDNLQIYLTNNNLQFRVNESGGPCDLGTYKPHNPLGRPFPSGLITFHKNYISETSDTNDPSSLGYYTSTLPFFYRPRTDTWNNSDQYASQVDYSVATNVGESDLLDSIKGVNDSYVFTPKHFEPYANITKSNTASALESRSRSQTISTQIRAQESLSNDVGIPIRAFVYAYVPTSNSDTWLATVDSVIIPTHSPVKEHFSPLTGTPASKTYQAPEPYKPDADTKGHYWMDENNVLLLRYRITWSSPCPNDVEGC